MNITEMEIIEIIANAQDFINGKFAALCEERAELTAQEAKELITRALLPGALISALYLIDDGLKARLEEARTQKIVKSFEDSFNRG